MKLTDFDYFLPPELIAQSPAKPRDRARLLVVPKKGKQYIDTVFSHIGDYCQPGDLLIVNDSKVIPARLIGKKASGGKVEILLSKLINKNWEIIGKNIPKPGEKIFFSKSFFGTVIAKNILQFNCSGKTFWNKLQRCGQIPLPPYIKSSGKKLDSERYQTMYADKRDHGSVAAPTAGLHFTPRLLSSLRRRGVLIKKITLHVGLGTFQPIRTADITRHTMHSEWIDVPASVLKLIRETKRKKHKVIAVGTTSLRALESAIRKKDALKKGYSGETDIFIYPPFKFRAVDSLITNFHLPKSTLLLLVSALVGKKTIKQAYQYAIKNKYRFYSYGDAMLII